MDLRTTWRTFRPQSSKRSHKNILIFFPKKTHSEKISYIFLNFGKWNFLASRLKKSLCFLEKTFSYVSGNRTFLHFLKKSFFLYFRKWKFHMFFRKWNFQMFFQKKFFFREKNFLYIFLRKTTLRNFLIFYQKIQFFLYFEK